MNSTKQAVAPQVAINASPYRVGFLLVDNFTLVALASAIEPLRMANQLAGSELYSWQLLSCDDAPIKASDGIVITPTGSTASSQVFDIVIVVGGVDITRSFSGREVSWLQSQAKKQVLIGAVCTGAYVLASAGLLDGYNCSAHWECLAAMRERFPHVNCTNKLYTLDRNRMTCTGGSVPMDMMLSMITRQHGTALTSAICDMFIWDRVRSDSEHQRAPLRQLMVRSQPKLAEITELMEANLEEPIALEELASFVGICRRQLERLFLKHLNCTPSRYYLKLRLDRARQLLKQTTCSIIEIANMCGFVSAPHFSRCYRKYIGVSPKEERAVMWSLKPVGAPMEGLPPSMPTSSSAALRVAQAEPTFGMAAFVPVVPKVGAPDLGILENASQ